jgi:hypothetical protein
MRACYLLYSPPPFSLYLFPPFKQIQRAIRERFATATVLMIAHR